MGRVFLVQRPSFKSAGRWADKYDLSPAERYGTLVECLPPGNIPRELSATRDRLKEVLKDFKRGEDYLVAIGDPVAIAMATLIADKVARGGLRILKWDRRSGEYAPYILDV